MEVLNQEGGALESQLASAQRPSEIAELGKRLKSVNDDLRLAEERWLQLSSQLETSAA